VVITLFTKGASTAALTADGAIAGAVGMIVYCIAAVGAIKRYKALAGSTLALIGWFLVSCGTFVLLRVALGW
jgi:hypothetical protein